MKEELLLKRLVRGFLVILSLYFASSGTGWASSFQLLDFSENWIASQPSRTQLSQGVVEAQAFTRVTPLQNTLIEIAHISYSKFPRALLEKKEGAKFDPKAWANFFKSTLHLSSFRIRQQKTATVIEGYWEKGNRFIRAYVREDKESISFSTAVYRPVYEQTVAIESELLQRHLMGVLEQPYPWLDRLISAVEKGLGIPKAFAADCMCPTDPSDPSYATCITMCQQQQQQEALIRQQTEMVNSLQNVTTLGNQGITTVNTQMTDVNSNWKTTNSQLQEVKPAITSASDSIKRFTRLDYIAGAAFAGSLGAWLATSGAALFVSGVNSLGEFLHEVVTGKKEAAELSALFQNAIKDYENLSDNIKELESRIDSSIYMAILSKTQKGGRAELLKKIGLASLRAADAVKDLESKKEQLREKAGICLDCEREKANERILLLKDLKDQTDELYKNMNSEGRSAEEAVCRKAHDNLLKLVASELLLHEARIRLLGGELAMVRVRKENTLKNMEIAEKIRPNVPKVAEAERKSNEEIYDEADSALRSREKRYEALCVKRRPVGITVGQCQKEGPLLIERRAELETFKKTSQLETQRHAEVMKKETSAVRYDVNLHAMNEKQMHQFLERLKLDEGDMAPLRARLQAKNLGLMDICGKFIAANPRWENDIRLKAVEDFLKVDGNIQNFLFKSK